MKEISIIKTEKCSSLSGRSTLTYNVGQSDDKEVHLSIVGNSGSGVFNKNWVSLKHLDSLLEKEKGPITSTKLQPLFKGQSANSAGFFLAVLLNEKLLKISSENSRQYERVSMQDVDEKPQKKKRGKS